uniref:Myb-like domain-containing protein n=1 Tax=Trepomonas sp. PC1 TaxID=1076344 RepID=A0A146K4P0_9EUKA|eukprot:JAP91852.1 Hypothetical protein TPC1_16399 [Trepomonas sp. PC1]
MRQSICDKCQLIRARTTWSHLIMDNHWNQISCDSNIIQYMFPVQLGYNRSKIMKRKYTRWTGQERSMLLAQIEQQMNNNCTQLCWITIAKAIQTKSPRQCYDQYLLVKKRQQNGIECPSVHEEPAPQRKKENDAIELLSRLLNSMNFV